MERVLLASVFSRPFEGPREGGCVEDTEACGSYSGRRGRRAVGAPNACLRGATVRNPDETRVCRHDTILEAFSASSYRSSFVVGRFSAAALSLSPP